MKSIKKSLALLLTVLMILPGAVACKKPEDEPSSLSSSEPLIEANGVSVAQALEMQAGDVLKPEITFLPEGAEPLDYTLASSDDTILAVVDGKLVAKQVGTATVTVTAGAFTAKCAVTVTLPPDPMDSVDYSDSIEISDLGGYMGTLRVKSGGELMFSPNLYEVANFVRYNGGEYSDFTAYLRFTALDMTGAGKNHSYRSVEVPPVQSKGDWVDFFLQGNGIDCGFCPTAGVTYRVELAVVWANNNKCYCHGTYDAITVSNDYEDSPFYNPSEDSNPNFKPKGLYTLTYGVTGHGSVEGQVVQNLIAGEESSPVTAVAEDGYFFAMWSDGVTTATRSGDTVEKNTTVYACFVKTKLEPITVADLKITTADNKPVTNKQYRGAKVTVENAGEEKRNIKNVSAQIRGRGNSSFSGGASQSSYDSKNSYRLRFDEAIKFLGIGDSKNKDWVLNSNKFDVSGLRNRLVWDMANLMGTIPYVPDCAWVNLYMNGEYRGMYMVTELIETAKDRVEVDEDDGNGRREDVGFMIETDFRGNYETEPYFYIDGYGPSPDSDLHGAVEFCIKSKLSDDPALQAKQVSNIEAFIKRCDAAIMSGDRERIEELVDIQSLVDLYIIEEWGKDCDSGRASFFLQRQSGGKLYFTAPWDFDFCFGTYGPATNPFGLVSNETECCVWHGNLVNNKWFRDLVLARMEELDEALTETMLAVRIRGAMLTEAADKNDELWGVYGSNYHQYVSSQASSQLDNFNDHIDFLVEWAEMRWENLKDEMIDY